LIGIATCTESSAVTLRDAIGLASAATGLVLLAAGRPLFGVDGRLAGVALLAIGILLIYLAKRQRQIDHTLNDLSLPGDGDYLSGSHELDLSGDD
jgi:uncharacterized protein YjeT (DUF2065 family)